MLQLIYRLMPSMPSAKTCHQLVLPALIIGCHQAVALPARSDSSAAAPTALKTILVNIDAAANGRKLPELSRYYSSSFTTGDGLTKATLQQSLGQFWQNYTNTSYATTLDSWQGTANNYTATTTTKITGIQKIAGRVMNLQSTIQSRQKIVAGQIVQQQVLQEQTKVTSGVKPPTIELNLPNQLKLNAEYNLEAIVIEPLGEDVLMGTTLEQPVSAQGYNQAANYKLELLTAGGLFKVARAPGKSGDYWFSTIFIRPSGMTTLTQRVRVGRK